MRTTRRQINYFDDEGEKKKISAAEKNDSTLSDDQPKDSIFNSSFNYSQSDYDEFIDLEFPCSGAATSQNRLTQIIPQEGRFTYHPDFDVKNWKGQTQKLLIIPKNQIESSKTLSSIMDASDDYSFFHLLKENMMTDQFKMISEDLINSHENFYMASARNINFLRVYLRLYRKITLKLFGRSITGKGEFLKVSSNYLKFFRDFYEKAFAYWKQSNIMELFHFPEEERFSYDFFFNLCGHIFRLCLKHKQFNLDPSKAHIHCDIIFAFEYFEVVMKFLIKDFDHFMNSIGFYPSDIDPNVSDTMPIIIRMIWQDKKPNYVSSEFKYFISHLVKSYNLGIYKMFVYLMQLFTRLAETIRICAGNVRPYNPIHSLRVSVADELFVALQKDSNKLTKELDIKSLQNFANFTRQLPWLNQQFFVVILKRFINLTQHFHKGKYKLSLKMILHLYLTGDVSAVKSYKTKRMAEKIKQSASVNKQTIDFDALNNSEDLSWKSLDYFNPRFNVSNLEVVYRKYSSGGEKTAFGGNSMHIACRRGDSNWIECLWELVDPNLPDFQGYTPLNDAVRFGHTKCVEKLIESSTKSGLQLEFETASLVDGATPLHNAIKGEDADAIRLILQFGGRHLLKICDGAGQSAEDLLSELLKEIVSSINYNFTNVVPIFDNLNEAELYSWAVAGLIESYLATNQLWQFVDAYQKYILQRECLKEEVTDEDVREQFDNHFPIVWGRSSTEDDLDALMDDFKMLHKVHHFIEKFSQLRLVNFGDSLLKFFEPVLKMAQFYKLSD